MDAFEEAEGIVERDQSWARRSTATRPPGRPPKDEPGLEQRQVHLHIPADVWRELKAVAEAEYRALGKSDYWHGTITAVVRRTLRDVFGPERGAA